MLRAAALAVLICAGAARAGDADALRGVPAEATIVVVVGQPRLLIEAVRALPAVTAAQDLAPVRDALAAPAVKRFLRLIEYYERDLGAAWPGLLDAVAGKGITIATRAGDDPAPAVVILRGTDAGVSEQFVKLAVAALEDEIARGAGGPGVKHRTAQYEGVETVHLGPEFHLARVGATVTVSNNDKALKLSLDAAAGRSKGVAPTGPAAARTLVGGSQWPGCGPTCGRSRRRRRPRTSSPIVRRKSSGRSCSAAPSTRSAGPTTSVPACTSAAAT